ncbi:DUF2490 domain-containing protein [Sphingomonas sp. MAH-20]|uniref:DUF2490 domain-containing protein n=1 Tax=Sphingomonas horti TaxID=2682842 RepID=A0A6I4IXF9_9SPHN|nr:MULTISPECIES: DUF2490 domain-containing protein [Sphingomonas]MBA2920404.1 DUF2490 domain-containing protein [Sphingomonas sp. CGMCC 1.13658]MVO76658.1 DUF2490 domain-containing protein [Sphingomonas horti]
MRYSLILVSAAAISALATPAAAGSDAQLWSGVNGTVKLSDEFKLSQELVVRFSDNRNGLYEIESNTLLGYSVGKNVTLWAGYTHNPQYSGGDFTVMEHRAREQVTFDNVAKIGGGTLSGRLRLEQRWREGVDGTAWRVRPYVKYSLPFRAGHKTALVLSHESFVNLNNTGFQKTDGLDRMRNAIAVTTPIAQHVSLEVGYLNQHGFVRGGPDTDDHAATITLGLSF